MCFFQRLGRKSLLLISSFGALLSLSVLGYSLNSGASTLSSIAIVTFIMLVTREAEAPKTHDFPRSFATGIGPIPFIMIPEVSPPHVRFSGFGKVDSS